MRSLYPVPQKAPHVSARMNVPNLPEGQRPKATDVSPWYGVYKSSLVRSTVLRLRQCGAVRTDPRTLLALS